ncbi:hypothetical protein M441DRAFT_60025 [Trichoderma asperellum CBS 433.97]|uniref:Uncharacterized protein n=1 Tax=Trichoderma asperellum (strain ATCC 204424 / CBS 433.97 / NBRC 101777) TaxID=1042311 RepID=A0A2T3Z1V3_TRIA4|nr:hypothetical protein M441DRAFT_60025 [Trichoderma asperellum CBS 433.97]PTB38788.1 hypothetical protein M441DRAFT_60025 [Trichoderma asperellum CBS 433.97]
MEMSLLARYAKRRNERDRLGQSAHRFSRQLPIAHFAHSFEIRLLARWSMAPEPYLSKLASRELHSKRE